MEKGRQIYLEIVKEIIIHEGITSYLLPLQKDEELYVLKEILEQDNEFKTYLPPYILNELNQLHYVRSK